MREEHNSVLSTPTEADKIGRFDQHIGKTEISADISARPIYRSISSYIECILWQNKGKLKYPVYYRMPHLI